MALSKILSTGVLAPDSQIEGAEVDVVNINPTLSEIVTVETFDWGTDPISNKPTPVPVTPSGSVTIGPHTHQSFTVAPSFFSFLPRHFYEIRVTIPDGRQLLINCFALGTNGRVIEGNTVLTRGVGSSDRLLSSPVDAPNSRVIVPGHAKFTLSCLISRLHDTRTSMELEPHYGPC
jgi:hypothetical protein